MTYVQPDITVDEDAIAQSAYDLVAARVPGWQPAVGSLDTALIEASVRLGAELRGLVADVSDLIVQGLAESVLGVPRNDAQPARVTVTFALSVSGYVVPTGTLVGLTAPDGSVVAFATDAPSTTVGTTATSSAAAVVPGVAGNGLTGTAAVIDALPQVISAAAVTVSAGGSEDETDAAYLDRIVRRMRLVAVHPILPADFAALAIDVSGVFRAMALDGYDPVANTTGNVRTVTVVVQDTAGQPVTGSVRTAVDDLLQTSREVGFVVNVIDPIYTTVTVVVNVVKYPAAVTAQVQADVAAAVALFLDPARWGSPTAEGDPPWSTQPVVYLNQIIAVAGNVRGVQRVSSVTLNGGAADVTLGAGKPHALPLLSGAPTVNVT